MTIQEQLKTLHGKWVEYQGEEIFINSTSVSRSGIIKFQTNKQQFHLPEEDFNLEDFKVMQKEENKYLETPVNQSQEIAQGAQIFNNTNSIITTLMESINQVKQGTNIEQAQTINDLSKTVIEAVKTQVLAVKVMKGIS